MIVDRPRVFWKLSDTPHLRSVKLLHQPPRTGNGHPVQQPQKVGPQPFQQPQFPAPTPPSPPSLLLVFTRIGTAAAAGTRAPRFPFPKLPLRRRHQRAYAPHPQAPPERILPPLRHQVNLIPQISQRSIHRRSRQHQHFSARPPGDNLVQQPPVALPPVIAEIVRLVNHHQVIAGPVETCQVNPARLAGIARQIGMRQQRVAQPIARKWILYMPVGGLIQRPVFPQFPRAKHQNPFIPQLKILDNRQGRISLPQPHAVGQNAAAMRPQLGDDAARAVFLKLVKRVPNPRISEPGGNQILVARPHRLNILAEQLVQRLVIHPFRRIIPTNARQRVTHPLLDILRAPAVVPQAVEPFPQLRQRRRIVHRQVDFQIGVAAPAQPAPRKIGTAHDAGAPVRPIGKV